MQMQKSSSRVDFRRVGVGFCLAGAVLVAPVLGQNRTYNGLDNNEQDPTRGSIFLPEMRYAPPAYADGISEPAGADRPNPRMISNVVVDQTESLVNGNNLSDWVWQWGQFLDHDITLTEFGLEQFGVPEEPFNIPVPAGDALFDPDGTGTAEIGMLRSIFDPETGDSVGNPRQQVNQLTAFIDASNVYGSDELRAAWLRTGVGGKLKTSAGNLLPFNDGSQVNAGPGGNPSFAVNLFTAGDIRANEQSGLTSVHTLFVREHNRLADELSAENPDWTDEEVYQRARKVVGAIMQVITYAEFLPVLLGADAPSLDGAAYDAEIDPTIANEFANAAYRFGHTMLSPQIMRVDDSGEEISEGPLPIRDAFFNPDRVISEGGIEPILLGLSVQAMQDVDVFIVDDLRNFLFGNPGEGGFDLAALNIQRGRDHGLPDYNTIRVSMGLARKAGFADITSDVELQQKLATAYGDVDLIDPWVGGLAEDHVEGAMVGELILAIMVDQFTRLRDGDRFWYANDDAFTDDEVAALEATRLSDVIRRNTTLENVPDSVFRVSIIGGDGDGDGGVPNADLGMLCGSFGMMNVAMLAMFLPLMRVRFRS